jgi:DNA polymerase-3 subunit gamma/tau
MPGPATERGLDVETWDAARRSLRGMARAVYMPANFIGADGGTIRVELPNDAHRAKCEQQRSVVEEALAAVAGRPVTIELVVPGSAPEPAPATAGDRARPPADGPTGESGEESGEASGESPSVAADEDVDLDDLVDAPPESVKTPIDRLAEAFPGSELVDESR